MENSTDISLFWNNLDTAPPIAITSPSINVEESFTNCPFRTFVRLFINCVLSPFVIIVGIVGNILTIKLFKAKKRKNASSIFILCLAASDLLLLISKLIYVIYILGFLAFPRAIQSIPVRSTSWIYFSNIPERIGKLLTIGIMAERIWAVYFPLRLKQVWTKGRTKKIAAIIVIVILITTLPTCVNVFYFFAVDTSDHSDDYTPLQEGEEYVNNLAPWMEKLHLINSSLFDLASLLIIFILCIITIIGVKTLMITNDLTLSCIIVMKRKRRERRVTITMLTMALLQCVFCGPLNILKLLVYVKTIKTFEVPIEITGLTFLLLHLNSMVNFIIYGVADKELRRRYQQELKCCKCRRNKIRRNEYRISTVQGPVCYQSYRERNLIL